MISIKNIFRDGPGPSNTFSVHPYRIAKDFKDICHGATTIKATLYGQFIDKNEENFTSQALKQAISPYFARVVVDKDADYPRDITAIKFEAIGKKQVILKEKTFYFTKLGEESEIFDENIINITTEDLLDWTYDNGRTIWEYAIKTDSSNIEDYISFKWELMKKSVKKGLEVEGGLPGNHLKTRRASLFLSRALKNRDFIQQISKTISYSLAVIEESASGKQIVAAPTASSCGVVPGVLFELREVYKVSETRIIRGLLTAGLIGRLLYKEILSGTIQSDIVIATAMASGAATQIMGGSPKQIIAAASIALNDLECAKEYKQSSHLDYIELNAMAASKAMDNATWALLSDKNISKEIDFFYKLTMPPLKKE